jgi:pSer/pThr/pTyr-binding forkhead associated (FHA) protein
MNNPTTLIIIIVVLSCTAAGIILAVKNNRKKNDLRDLNNAARKLIKEQNLNAVLSEGPSKKMDERMRMVIALSWKNGRKRSYVFDPVDSVRIGRQPDINNLVLPDDEVSLRHCVLYRRGNSLVLEDLHSTNGTVCTHGLQKKEVHGAVYVYDGDRIRVGGTQLLLRIFWIDSAYL